tara:strand:+ start:918 stop:1490 length:573 start_codon:yes stop_codon:yes gene_type:complete
MKRVIFLLLFLISSGQLICSVHNNPFDSLSISIQLIKNINRNIFHDFYEPRNGIKTSITTPFYWGDIQGSIQVVPYYNKGQSDADFTGIEPNLKWGKQLYLSDKLKWFNGGGIGWYIFYFSDEIVVGKIESELSTSYTSQLSLLVHKKISLSFEINKDTIFTYKKIDLVYISIGINYLTKTPDWVKLLLK